MRRCWKDTQMKMMRAAWLSGLFGRIAIAAVVAGAAGHAAAQSDGAEEQGAETQPATTTDDGKGAPVAEASSEEKQLFERAAAAIRSARTISYQLTYRTDGTGLAARSATVEASIRQLRVTGGSTQPGWMMRVTGTSRPRDGAGESTDFDIAWLTSTVEYVDHKNKKVMEQRLADARRNRAYSVSTQARFDPYYSLQPLAKEIAAESFTVGPREEVGGVMCDVVTVKMPKVETLSTWYIGVDDSLPRKVVRLTKDGPLGGNIIIEVSDVRVESGQTVSIAADTLRVSVPEGYGEDRLKQTPVQPVVVSSPDKAGDKDIKKPVEGEVTPAPVVESQPVVPVPVVPTGPRMAPAFELVDGAGQKVTLESLKGSVVVLHFAGTWALPVKDSLPELETLTKKHAGKPVKVYWMSVRERVKQNATVEMEKGAYTFGLLLDATRVAADFGAHTFPSVAVVSATGELVMEPTRYVKTDSFSAIDAKVEAELEKIK